MSDKVIKPSNSDKLVPKLDYTGKRMYVTIRRSCLKQDKITFNHKNIVNIYIAYDLESNLNNFDTALENCLLEAVKLTKNNDIDKYKYAVYGIGFDSKGTFPCPGGSFAQNVIIFVADMSSSMHANNRTKSILILGEGFTQGLEDTKLYGEKTYSINFTATRK